MLFDIAYVKSSSRKEMKFKEHSINKNKSVDGYAETMFFYAKIENGILTVPKEKYLELYQLEARHA